MIITCPACSTRFTVKAEAFKAPRKVRCAKCGAEWTQEAVPDEEPVEDAAIIDDTDAAPEAPPSPPDDDFASALDAAADDEEEEDFAPETPVRRKRAQPKSAFDPEPQARKRRRGAIFGWVVLVTFLVLLGALFVAFRGDIVQMWPATSRLYAAIGLPAQEAAMEFKNVVYSQEKENGLPVLTVRGQIVNVADNTKPVPRIRVSLRDGKKNEVYSYTFAVPETELAPGGTAEFVTRLSSPPEAARDLVLRFVEPGEVLGPSGGSAAGGGASGGHGASDH